MVGASGNSQGMIGWEGSDSHFSSGFVFATLPTIFGFRATQNYFGSSWESFCLVKNSMSQKKSRFHHYRAPSFALSPAFAGGHGPLDCAMLRVALQLLPVGLHFLYFIFLDFCSWPTIRSSRLREAASVRQARDLSPSEGWWRRGELNPCPWVNRKKHLRA